MPLETSDEFLNLECCRRRRVGTTIETRSLALAAKPSNKHRAAVKEAKWGMHALVSINEGMATDVVDEIAAGGAVDC